MSSSIPKSLAAAHHRVPAAAVRGWVIGEHGRSGDLRLDHHGERPRCRGAVGVRPGPAVGTAAPDQRRDRPYPLQSGRRSPRQLRKTLSVSDGAEVFSVNHDGVWLGIRLQFSAGRPAVVLPDLDPDEQLQFTAARTRLDSSYQQTLQGATAC
ncbi:hypothetical protein ACWD48_11565 [Streptomyces sp. NPDC002519]